MRSINKVAFDIDQAKFWNFAKDLLLFTSYAFKIEIHSFVLMSNHYHMILRTPEANLNKFMEYFNKELGREIYYSSGRINYKFGARYHSSIIKNLSYYHHAYKYVYRNPVEAGLSRLVEDYPFSSLGFLLGKEPYGFPIFDTYFENLDDHWTNLQWLNTSYEDLVRRKISLGLRKPYFSI